MQLCHDVVVTAIDDGALVVNLETGKTWKLNRVGAAVCRGIEQDGDLPRIATEIADRYGIEVAAARRDIDVLLSQLQNEGLVEPTAGG